VTLDPTLDSNTTPISAGPDAPIAPARTAVMHNVFLGKDGIRAGWSLLIFIAIFAATISATHFIVLKFHHPHAKTAQNAEDSIQSTIINEAVIFFVVLFVTWIMSRIEQRPNSVYGLGGDRKAANFFSGVFWGVGCLSLLVLILWKAGLLIFDGRLLFGRGVFGYGALWLVGFLLVGLLEEYLTRGYLQYTLTRGLAGFYRSAFKAHSGVIQHSEALGFWTAAVVFSVLFGLGHSQNPGESPFGLVCVGLVAMVFCLSLWRTGSLWWAIGFHASWDWAQSFLYGVADSGHVAEHRLLATHPAGKPILSGGATGPEGSIFVVAILGLIVLIILLTLKPVPRDEAEVRSA
jgi:uncharacterized protein